MKKIIGILSVALLPAIAFAQNYSQRMVDFGNRGYGYTDTFQSAHSMFGLMSFVFIIPIIGIIVVITLFIFWLLMLIDAIKYSSEKLKIVWVLVIIFAHIIGALVYYFVEKRPRDKTKTVHHVEHKKEETV